jgi:hypothetical protein
MGVAWTWDSSNICFTSLKDTHYKHLTFLQWLTYNGSVDFYFEELNFFRNAKTVRSLLLRTGYVAYSLSENVKFVSTTKPRKFLGCKNKKEVFDLLIPYGIKNNDESDAIALLLFVLQKKQTEVTFERFNDYTAFGIAA